MHGMHGMHGLDGSKAAIMRYNRASLYMNAEKDVTRKFRTTAPNRAKIMLCSVLVTCYIRLVVLVKDDCSYI